MSFLARIILKHNPGTERHQSEIVTLFPARRPAIGKICEIMENVFFINFNLYGNENELDYGLVGLDGIARNSTTINLISQ